MQLFLNLILISGFLSAAIAQETTAPATEVKTEAIAKASAELSPALKNFCPKLQKKFNDYKWGDSQCEKLNWNHVRSSNLGTPLVWLTFGDENNTLNQNTTLILCGVHGDEITPVKFCWDLIKELQSNHSFADKMVVVAPLVAPDSFIINRPTRTNGRGVDVNRNFPTMDWQADAHKRWKQVKDKRKFPGHKAASEQETIFQMNLIKRYKPNKVISVHAPLTLLDYDGPALTSDDGRPAKALLEQMSEKSAGYKVSNYPIFPGSLGNWAGKENHIPTYTLELPNTNPQETDKFWAMFKDALTTAMENKMKPVQPLVD